MNQSPSCKHQHTRVIAKDNEAEYIECLDCGAVLETRELTESPAPDASNFDESLSDA
jgi:transcription initiation factor TFIIIB Brf1 subunit/transcription initiation factor TFIIB